MPIDGFSWTQFVRDPFMLGGSGSAAHDIPVLSSGDCIRPAWLDCEAR